MMVNNYSQNRDKQNAKGLSMEYESRKYFQKMLSIFLLTEKNERCMSIGGRAFHSLITLLKKKCFV